MDDLGDIAASYVNDLGFGLIALRPRSKEPATPHGVKDWTDDAEGLKEWFHEHPKHNIGVALGEASHNVIVIDIDVDDDQGYDGHEAWRKWEKEHGELPETVTAITGRGGTHLYYRVDRKIHPHVNEDIHIDIRGDGSYAMLPPSTHPNGNVMEWENHPDDYEIADADDNVYSFLEHISGGDPSQKRKFHMPKEIKSGGRNKTLMQYGCSMQGKGYDDDVIAAAIIGANSARCKPPLPDDEVDKIIESVLDYNKGMSDEAKRNAQDKQARSKYRKKTKDGRQTGPILHNIVARELIENHRACFVDGAPAIWNGQRYASGWDEVNRAIINLIDDCKMADQREIRNYVHLKAPKVESMKPWYIAFENGVLDIDCGLQEYDEDMIVTNIIPHNYNPDAYDATADQFLDNISCHDPVIRKNLEEVIGVCMYRANDFGQCPVLIGVGSNGKSSYITVLRNILGNENVSSLDINVIGKPFQAGRLLGKLANLGDDISNERLSGDILAVFKKIVTGEWIYTDVKNSDGFEFKPYCTLVFSCNDFPRLGDSSEGMLRRLFPIPFEARFSRSDPDYDPRITDKLTTENAAEYFIKVGIEGLLRVRDEHGFTASSKSLEIVEEVKSENDTIVQWIEEEDITLDWIVDKETKLAYSIYFDWCKDSGIKAFGKPKFSRKMNDVFKVVSKPTTRNCRSMRVYRKV